jgi:hypothetical protein
MLIRKVKNSTKLNSLHFLSGLNCLGFHTKLSRTYLLGIVELDLPIFLM